MKLPNVKKVGIGFLVLVVIIQAAWIFKDYIPKLQTPSGNEQQVSGFQLTSIDLSENAGESPGYSSIYANLSFTQPVSPEDLLAHVRLVDESDDKELSLQVTTSWSSRSLAVRSEDVKKSIKGKRYKLLVDAKLRQAGSDAELGQACFKEITLIQNPVLTFKEGRAESSTSGGTLWLAFSTPMAPATAKSFLNVGPNVDYSLSSSGKELVVMGNFKPGKTYMVTMRSGLTAADGAVLKSDVKGTVVMPDLKASVDFVGSGIFLPLSIPHKAAMVVEAVNTSKAVLQIDRVFPNNLFSMLSHYGQRIFDDDWIYEEIPQSLGGKVYEKEITFPEKKNQIIRVPVKLDYDLSRKGNGLYRLSLSTHDDKVTKRWALITDIGLVAKRDKTHFTVWAVSNKTLKPISGIYIDLISDKNQKLAQKLTNAQGVAKLKLPQDSPKGTPYLIVAKNNTGDFSFLLPSRFRVDTAGLDVAGATISSTGVRGYIYGERTLYRPGEVLKAVAVVRNDDFSIPSNMPLVLSQKDPKGREIRKIKLTADAHGISDINIPVPEFALTGGYSLSLSVGEKVVGTYEFNVEEFIPDRIKVEIETGVEAFEPGQSISAEVKSHYLFGPPAANLPVSTRAVLKAIPFTSSKYPGYSFGDSDRTFQPQEFYAKESSLDGAGNGSFSIQIPNKLMPPSALEAVIYGRVSENGGRGVTARKRVLVHPYSYYLGVKNLERNGFEYGKPVKFDFVAVSKDGTPVEFDELQAELYKNRWRTVVRRTPSGEYRYQSVNDPKLIESIKVPSGVGKQIVEFTPPTYGSYTMKILSPTTGAAAGTNFYCGGWGYSPWALENPARIELALDKEQYDAGDIAVVQLRAPFSGRVIVSIEGENVLESKVVELEGNTGEVRFPVKKEYVPNVYVTALLMRKASDITEGSVGRAFGAVPLLVDNKSNKIDLHVSAPSEVRPESDFMVEIEAEPGAIVTVAAVDEGIMQLAGSKDPDPFDYFYARRALGVDSFDTFAMLYPDMAKILGKIEVGGDMAMKAESQFMRTEGIRRVKPVSFWSGPLVADKDGIVRYAMTLPDFQGALRVVAVAADGKRFGQARTMTLVRSPLAVTPTLPRFLSPGDSIEMPVTVRNDIGNKAAVSVEIVAEGAVEISGDYPKDLQLEDGEEKTLYIPLLARFGAGGAAKITVRASTSNESRRVVTELPVRPAVPYRRELAFGAFSEGSGQLVASPEGYMPGTVTRSVALSRLPMARFTGKLEYLLGYPYGCAEQTTSKAFPLIRFGDLAKAFAPHLINKQGPARTVQAAITRLRTMQTNNGGFAYWPGEDSPRPWVSAYVTHFLLEGEQAGFVSGMSVRALDYMGQLSNERSDLDTTAYALYNLSKAGRPNRGAMDELRDKHMKKLSATARVLLACAYSLAGDVDSFNLLLVDLPGVSSGRYWGDMRSDLSEYALMLMVLADAHPGDSLVPELTAKVSQLMEGYYWTTTLENGLTFSALGKMAGNAGPLSGQLVSGKSEYAFLDEMAFTEDAIPGDAPIMAEFSTGDSPVYWSVTSRGIPTPGSLKPISEGLSVERFFLDRDGAPLDLSNVQQGDLVIMRTRIKATERNVKDTVVQLLLPAGLEVENARLATTESAAFIEGNEKTISGHQDLRDDRILFFTDVYKDAWRVGYTQLRAVTPGVYNLPPVQAEAMYDPSIKALGELGKMTVTRKE
ncbi:alpha-2-macroglobulin family protein [Pseudodesulfovibrio sediminis]|uniref:Membrane protein n=1 Tax=Pseudodesulfovibrio sediminis TaxID=2810563 RepID=A0ABN6EWR5_9BACT|nr:alpha-2-macroglobulin [Pseudodesulfovibrio sediminis]BCS89471.1 membrane protein [Pseudodesulfovibrio sediminis]